QLTAVVHGLTDVDPHTISLLPKSFHSFPHVFGE
ncbi:MAG: hypothetical protein ACI9S9_004389, partial [Planctomycetota bacterium]